MSRDAEGWPIIAGRLGRIQYHDGQTLAVYTDRPRLVTQLWARPGVRRWQLGNLGPGGSSRPRRSWRSRP